MNGDLISRSALLEELRKGTIITDDLYGIGIMAGNDHTMKKIEAAPAVIDRFKEAFGSIASYNGHEEWLWELSDELAATDRFVSCPITDAEWLTDKHALWMMLVSAFGNWGTSIRSGWIEKTKEAAKFINDATDRYAEWRADDATD